MKTIKCGEKLNLNFKNGTILRADTLNCLNLSSEEIRKNLFSDYPDGIISGFSLKKSEEKWFFSSGLVKIKNTIYTLRQVSEEEIHGLGDECDCDYYLCLKEKEKEINDENLECLNSYENKDADCIISNISKEYAKYKNEKKPESFSYLELCAVKKSEFCTHQSDYILIAKYSKTAGKIRIANSFDEFKESSNRLSTLDGNYSISGEFATSPDFTDYIKSLLDAKEDKDYLDVSLYLVCSCQRCIARKSLLFYCGCKLQRQIKWNDIIDSLSEAIKININPIYQKEEFSIIDEKPNTNFNHNL